MMDPELEFQSVAFDPRIRGGSPDVDSAPQVQRGRKAALSPQAYHNNTADKTLAWEIEKALAGLGDILSDDET